MKFMDQLLRMRLNGYKPGILRVAIAHEPEKACAHEVHIHPTEPLDSLDLRPLYGLHLAVTFALESSNAIPAYLDAILAVDPASVVAVWTDSETGEGVFRRWNPKSGWSDIPTAVAA